MHRQVHPPPPPPALPHPPQVTVARCDSHALFRNARDVRSMVVLLRRGCSLPQPHQLATSLQAQESLEDRM